MPEDWYGAIAECNTVEVFNDFALSLARDRRKKDPNDGFAKAVAKEAQRRKYTYIGSRDNGFYVDVTPTEHKVVMNTIDELERKEDRKRLLKMARKTRVPMVQAAWEEWVFNASAAKNMGTLLILDFRKRKDNKCIYQFDMVPEELFLKLFEADAKSTLKQIYTIFKGQERTEIHNWKEAF